MNKIKIFLVFLSYILAIVGAKKIDSVFLEESAQRVGYISYACCVVYSYMQFQKYIICTV